MADCLKGKGMTVIKIKEKVNNPKAWYAACPGATFEVDRIYGRYILFDKGPVYRCIPDEDCEVIAEKT